MNIIKIHCMHMKKSPNLIILKISTNKSYKAEGYTKETLPQKIVISHDYNNILYSCFH